MSNVQKQDGRKKMEERKWENTNMEKRNYFYKPEMCFRQMGMQSIYTIPKNLNFSEDLLKPKNLGLSKFCSFAILHFCLISA